jgi:hypothetical protein
MFFQALLSRIISEPWRKWRLRCSQDTSYGFAFGVISNTDRYDEVAFCDMTIIQNFGKIGRMRKNLSWTTHTHTQRGCVTGRFALSKGRRIKMQCIIHVWYINGLGPDHRVTNVLELQSHSTVLPFTYFFPLFPPFLHSFSAHSSSSSKSRSSLVKILYRQPGLLMSFDIRLFLCLSLQTAILRAETKIIRKRNCQYQRIFAVQYCLYSFVSSLRDSIHNM